MVTALSLADLANPASASDWNAAMLTTGATVGLPTTAWQPGSIERSILAVVANVDRLQGVSASIIAQAGFLSFSATGYVDTVDPDGTAQRIYVTPDPSIPAQNPNGALGWLDVLADGAYDVRRILSTFAGGVEALINTSVNTYGPFVAGTYHIAQAGAPGAPPYSNTASLTLAPSSTTTNPVTGAANASGVIRLTVTAHGLSTGAAVFVTGVRGTIEANGAWTIGDVSVSGVNAIDLVGSAFVNTWVSGGSQLVYLPTLAAFTADVAGTVSSATTPNVVSTSVTSLIGVFVNNLAPWLATDIEGNVALAARCRLKLAALAANGPKGAILFFALSSQQLAPTLSPPQTVASAITRALVTLDITTGSIVVTLANAAGAPGTQDVAVTGLVIQANAILFGGTLVVQAAGVHNVAVAVTLYLPASFATATTTGIVQSAVSVYFQALSIGGISDPSGAQNVVPIEGVRGAIEIALAAANIPRQDLVVTLNGVAANVQLLLTPTPEVAVLVPSLPTVGLVAV